MRKRPEYLGYIASTYLCIGILTAALGAEAPLMTPGIFLFRRFHLAAFYFPVMISLGALLVHTGRTPRMIMRLIWLSPVPFLTAALTLQTAAARMEFTTVSALTDAFGRIPATLLLILLFALETVGFVKLAALGLPRDETLFDLSAVKQRLNAFLYELGLVDMHPEAYDEEGASESAGAREAAPAGEPAFPGAGAAEAGADLREFPGFSDSSGAVEAPGFDGSGSAGADIPGILDIPNIPIEELLSKRVLSDPAFAHLVKHESEGGRPGSSGGAGAASPADEGPPGGGGAGFPAGGIRSGEAETGESPLAEVLEAEVEGAGAGAAFPPGGVRAAGSAFPGAGEGPPGAAGAALGPSSDEGASERFRDAPSLVSGPGSPVPGPPSEVTLSETPFEAEAEGAVPAGPSEVTLSETPFEAEAEWAVPAGPSEVTLSETSLEAETEGAVPAGPSEVTLSETPFEAETEGAVPAGPSEVTLSESPLEAEAEAEGAVPAGPSEVTLSETPLEAEAEAEGAVPAGPSEVTLSETPLESEAEEAFPAPPSEVTLSEPPFEAESEGAVPAGPSEVTLTEPPFEAEAEGAVPAGPSEVTLSEDLPEMEGERPDAAGPSEVNFLEDRPGENDWSGDEGWSKDENGEGAAISRKLGPQGAEPRGIVGEKPAPTRPRGRPRYEVPSAGVLADYPDSDFSSIDDATRRGGAILEQTLKEFRIDARVTGIRKGPVITMYELLPSPGVKISSIVNLQDNIALRLAASRVRMVAPIPGKHAIGIEVPNKKRAIVSFSSMVESDEFRESDAGIPVILGKDISGGNQVIDLTRTPHLLIAGATGSGKSVCVNSLIGSILYSRAPVDVKMIMVDPKIVELKLYNDIPHLLTPVITEPKRALQALQWCLCEMERRYSLLDSQGVRDMNSYNRRVRDRRLATERLPYIVVVVDEFADLMATSGKELEGIVARLAAMSRAVGIHLVLATQRPSVDVITGLIKANFPSRIAFMVAGKTDSRIIIDAMGAEKLLGRGDMLFTSAWDPFPSRMQGAFLAEEEVERMAEYVKGLGEPEYIDDEMFFDDEDDDEFELEAPSGDDPMYEKALEIVVSTRKASASYLQRRLKIGYNRAARLVEEMERRGIVGPANGSKPRDLIHIPDRFSTPPGTIASGAAEQESAPA